MARVLTIGTFDLFHAGHVELLRECRRLAGRGKVVVGVNGDEFVKSFKGRAPVIPWDKRVEVVGACSFVDWVAVHEDRTTTRRLIADTDPDIIAVGDDWKDRDYLGQLGVTQDWLDSRGIEVVYVPRTTSVSSSAIRSAL